MVGPPPPADRISRQQGSRGPGRKKWRRATVVAAARQRGVLPSAGQENEDLVGASEAARILGYSSADSFISALGHGLLPDLEQVDGYAYRRGSNGRPRQQRWKRSRLKDLASRRSSPS
ncbi:hypothetical protein [Streptomyces sp. NPDC126514]|uniref:hypothetical protein n=1 Tax=Streptomyces sp. NPDC126514 TaxID=3155210 RepID=UPI003319C843